ncbi:MAG: SDR family NAD(P)-dependent oxidoreductase [Saprospiraceae bacterium]|nr:SDR family NAD(P)-dependent oxidoreductase [Saprospiraceae bacterium]
MENTKSILITGATGFIGSYVCRQMVQLGYDVHITKRMTSRTSLIDLVKDKITMHEVSLTDIKALDEIVAQVDVIIHCAAIITIQPHTKDQLFDLNVGATRDLVNLALHNNIDHFVFLSSVAALGVPKKDVTLDESHGWDDMDTHGDYGKSKYRAELEVRRAEAEGLNVTILNPALVLGAGFWNSGTPSIFKKLDGLMPFMPMGSNGFVDVRDIANGVANAVLNPNAYGHRIILSGHNASLKEAFNMIRASLNRKPVNRFLDKSNAWFFIFLDFLKSVFTRSQRVLTKGAVKTMSSKKKYSNAVSKEILKLDYRPLSTTIQDTVDSYRVSNREGIQYGILSFD